MSALDALHFVSAGIDGALLTSISRVPAPNGYDNGTIRAARAVNLKVSGVCRGQEQP